MPHVSTEVDTYRIALAAAERCHKAATIARGKVKANPLFLQIVHYAGRAHATTVAAAETLRVAEKSGDAGLWALAFVTAQNATAAANELADSVMHRD